MIRTYTDPRFPSMPRMPRKYFSEGTYLEMVEGGVIPTVDIVILRADKRGAVTDKRLWLASRTAKPAPGPFFLGGRWQADQRTVEEAAAFNLDREASFEVSPDRLKYLFTAAYQWGDCAQGDFPNRTNGALCALVVSEHECGYMASRLTRSEYTRGFGLKPFARKDLEALMGGPSGHEVFLDAYDEIFPTPEKKLERVAQVMNMDLWRL